MHSGIFILENCQIQNILVYFSTFQYNLLSKWPLLLLMLVIRQEMMSAKCKTRATFWYPIRRLIVISRKASKARNLVLNCSYLFDIWQALRQQCCRVVCQTSEWSDNSKHKSHGFETLRDLIITRLIGYWNRAQLSYLMSSLFKCLYVLEILDTFNQINVSWNIRCFTIMRFVLLLNFFITRRSKTFLEISSANWMTPVAGITWI